MRNRSSARRAFEAVFGVGIAALVSLTRNDNARGVLFFRVALVWIAALVLLARNDNARGKWLVSFSVIARSRRRRGNPVLKLALFLTLDFVCLQ